MLRLLRAIGIVLVVVSASGCALRVLPAYDPAVTDDINSLHKKIVTFLNEMQAAGRTAPGHFNNKAVQDFYASAIADADNLAVRVTIRDNNGRCPIEAIRELATAPNISIADAIRSVASPRPSTSNPTPAVTTDAGSQAACTAVNVIKIGGSLRTMRGEHSALKRIAFIEPWMRIFNTLVRNALFVEEQLKSATPKLP